MVESRIDNRKSVKSPGAKKIVTEHLEHGLEAFVLTNARGMNATILNYGATIAGIEVPDRDGKVEDVTLGHDDLTKYIGGRFYLGATIGRFANRIAGGRFAIDGKEYHVTANKNGNLLHGGSIGFDKKFWASKVVESGGDAFLELDLVSPDGDEGFPGRLEVKVTYSLSDEGELLIRYSASTDKPTVVNMTNHSYFNLTGSPDNSILDHVLRINADSFTPTDSGSIPTGQILDVTGTPMDFRELTLIGARIDDEYGQLISAKGYDYNWVLNDRTGEVREIATVYDPSTGRIMEVMTDQPGVQFYSGNYLDGSMTGKGGIVYGRRSGLCLECQAFPNAPNVDSFPSTVLRLGQMYSQTTIYKFSVDR